MAKRTYDELLKEYGLERKETDFERDMKTYSPKIQAGIEASKKRNAELAKDVDKRRADYEAKQQASSEAKQKAAKEQSKKPSGAPKRSPVSYATTVRHHKGGGATAEVDTEKVARQTKADAAKKPSQSPKNTASNEGMITPKKKPSKASSEEQTKKTPKKPIDAYRGGPEWRNAIKRTLSSPLRLIARATEKQEKKKKGSRYGSPYQLKIR